MTTEASEVMTVKAPAYEIHMMKPEIDLKPDILEKAKNWMDKYHKYLTGRVQAYAIRMSAEAEKTRTTGVMPESGGAVTYQGYSYWNALSAGPIQFPGDPPWRPSKIIAADEIALMVGCLWVNAAPDPGGGITGTTALGSRPYRVRFEQVDLTHVGNGPDAVYEGTFPAVPPTVNLYAWFFVPPDPGQNPHLMEVNFTADVTHVAQPFAAFATWHYDPDTEPGFLYPPTMPAHWQFERPARYLIYRK